MKKLLLVSGVVLCVALGIAVMAFIGFPHVVWFYTARYMMPEKEYGFMYEKPIKRTVSAAGSNPSQNHSFDYGSLAFKTSWPAARKITRKKNLTTVLFPGSKTLFLSKPDPLPLAEEIVKSYEGTAAAEKVFGKKALATDFTLHKLMMDISLNDMPRNSSDMARRAPLTIYKSIFIMRSDRPPMYRFETPSVRGWQVGKPGKDVVNLMFYDKHDVLYEMNAKGVSQEEIDMIIRTMRDR